MATTEIRVPDIGGFKDVNVIDILVKDGLQIEKETPLITIETEKAAMDVPSPVAGRIVQVKVKQGDKVSEGSVILSVETETAPVAQPSSEDAGATRERGSNPPVDETDSPREASEPAPGGRPASGGRSASGAGAGRERPAAQPAPAHAEPPRAEPASAVPAASASAPIDEKAFSRAYASPSVRRFARELGADLGKIQGTGAKGRITPEDVKAHVKALLAAPPPAAAVSPLPKVPVVDFEQFGPVEMQPLSRIQKISGARLQASWLNLPHVTQHEDADITELEAARNALKGKAAQEGVRLTPLTFIIRACILALREFPRFNSSLDASGENLVLKKYFNIGFAADTPNGLVVPVIANANRLSLFGVAQTLAEMSGKARDGKLKAAEMQGGSFTISSLGGIGGTAFTPIINAPEVAILGVSKSAYKPVYRDGGFVPRLMLPLSLSYDHRVIDGAQAARFVVRLAAILGDPKALM
jgi:pyruvate dehydrogenase E2 component (dihydrolipoamide acetyltransferase)